MWKTEHVILITTCAVVASITLTLFVQSKIDEAISRKAAEQSTGSSKKNPLEMMSALSSSNRKGIPTSTIAENNEVQLEMNERQGMREKPSGAGQKWTPLQL